MVPMMAPLGNAGAGADAKSGKAAAAAPMPKMPSASRRVQPAERVSSDMLMAPRTTIDESQQRRTDASTRGAFYAISLSAGRQNRAAAVATRRVGPEGIGTWPT